MRSRLRKLRDWAGRRQLPWAVGAAVAAVVLGGIAFQASPSGGSVVAAIGALLAALLYAVAWVDSSRARDEDPSWLRRLGRFVVLVVLSVLALGGAICGAAVILGRWLAHDVEPIDVDALYGGLLVSALVVAALVGWWAWAFQRNVIRRGPSVLFTLLAAAAVLAGGWFLLDRRTVPNQLDRAGLERARQAGNGRYDLLLVVDPADPASRRLIAEARASTWRGRGDGPFPPPTAGTAYDVAYGLALPKPAGARGPRWRLVEPPTTDRRELTDALARIEPRTGAPASTAYGRLLIDLLDDRQVRWRPDAQRGVVFLLRRLPSQRELDGGRGPRVRAVPVDGDWTRACSRFLDGWQPGEVPADRARPVRWGDALAAHCERRADQLEWELGGRLAARQPPPSVAVHAFTTERRQSRADAWAGWTRALDGAFVQGTPAQRRIAPQVLLRAARDVQTGVPIGELKRLTETFRPHLRLDAAERFLPVDVDWLLAEGGHRVCDRGDGANCEDVDAARDLAGPLDEYLDLAGGARGGRDLDDRAAAPGRMYVHVREHDGRVYLGYWWFMRFNGSPWRPEVNCLPGLTLSDLSCFDHEGDWEGVTVVLDLVRPRLSTGRHALANVVPEAVLYDSHGHPIRWRWEDVELAADDGAYATHPVVYAAAGSHASYPAPCRKDECNQRLAGSGVPEGGFDGGQPWPYDESPATCRRGWADADGVRVSPCLLAVPSTRDGAAGVLWNAFPGRWGAAVCTDLVKICAQVDGPRSPSLQARFRRPWVAADGPRGQLLRARRDHRPAVDDHPRWPPPAWPPPDGASAPTGTVLPAG